MKKLSFIIALIAMFVFDASAQRATLLTNNQDTVINTGTVLSTVRVTGGYQIATFQYVNTKVSGTVAGTAVFEGSNDAVNYFPLDTVTNLDVTTNNFLFEDSPSKYLWYRVKTTGSGTMRSLPKIYAIFKRY
jgi:hypothetical protein